MDQARRCVFYSPQSDGIADAAHARAPPDARAFSRGCEGLETMTISDILPERV